jgi:hypothetical protein
MKAPERIWIETGDNKRQFYFRNEASVKAGIERDSGLRSVDIYIRADIVAEKDKEIAKLTAHLKASDMNFTSANKCLWREMQSNKKLKRALELSISGKLILHVPHRAGRKQKMMELIIAQAEAQLKKEASDEE